MANFALKWKEDDPSNAIMLTFDSKWLQPLLDHKISYVFRKMGPRQFTPEVIYAYFSTPVSAVAAKCSVTSWESLGIEQAVTLAEKGSISPKDLRLYADNYSELLVIGIGRPIEATNRIEMQFMRKEFGFWPSSTFMPLSTFGCTTLDELGGFTSPK